MEKRISDLDYERLIEERNSIAEELEKLKAHAKKQYRFSQTAFIVLLIVSLIVALENVTYGLLFLILATTARNWFAINVSTTNQVITHYNSMQEGNLVIRSSLELLEELRNR